MRLWHHELIPYLSKEMLVSQWRECIAIKRQWEKGTLKHRLVSYVMNQKEDIVFNSKQCFISYVFKVKEELKKRGIKYNPKYWNEMLEFCTPTSYAMCDYPEHDMRYLRQCYYNLQEKYDRGIVSKEEWELIHKNIYGLIKE